MDILQKETNAWLNFADKFMAEKSYKEQRDLFIKSYAREHLKVKRAHEYIRNSKDYYKNTLKLLDILEGDI